MSRKESRALRPFQSLIELDDGDMARRLLEKRAVEPDVGRREQQPLNSVVEHVLRDLRSRPESPPDERTSTKLLSPMPSNARPARYGIRRPKALSSE